MAYNPLILHLLVVTIAVLDVVALEWSRSGLSVPQAMLLSGLASAQTGLLALWLVLGSGPVIPRAAFSAAGFAACQWSLAGHDLVYLPYTLFAERDLHQLPYAIGVTFCLLVRNLWNGPVRRFQRHSLAAPGMARHQFSLIDMLLVVTTIAMGLSCWHYARPKLETPVLSTGFLLSRIAIAVLMMRAVFSQRRRIEKVALPFAMAFAFALACESSGLIPPGTAWYPAAQLTLEASLFSAGLLVLRIAGLRLTNDPRAGIAHL